jgi:F-type H+-transporting ATPase subunit epsilon
MLAALRVGELDIVDEGDRRRRFAVSGGLLEVTSEGVTVLVEAAEPADQIDEERARSARARAKERLQAHSSDTDMRRAEAALRRALNRLQVAGKDGSN